MGFFVVVGKVPHGVKFGFVENAPKNISIRCTFLFTIRIFVVLSMYEYDAVAVSWRQFEAQTNAQISATPMAPLHFS